MKLSREAFGGTGKVFSFTLRQMFFNKANAVSLIIMLLFALFSVPVMSFAGGGNLLDKGREKSEITRIYWVNETPWTVDFSELAKVDERFTDVETQEAGFTEDNYKKNIKDDEVLVCVRMEESEGGSMPLISLYSIKETDSDYEELSAAVSQLVQESRYRDVGITQEQIDAVEATYSTDTLTLESYYEKQSGPDFGTRYIVQYVYAIILMILGIFTTSYIIRAVVEEKSSKLVELLMVSVKPLALIMGKILAVMLYVFGMLVSLGLCAGISYLVTGVFMDTQPVMDFVAKSGFTSGALQIDPFLIVVLLVSLLLGYLTFSILSGLAGTSCSTMDDMQSANMSVTMIIMAGYFISVFTINLPSLATVVSLIPILSIFCAPVEYICGDIGIGVLLLSWLIQLLAVGLLFAFCANIYEDLILYKGQKMKWTELFGLIKKAKKGGQ